MNPASIIISIVTTLISGMLLYAWQSAVKENKKMRREKEERETVRSSAVENGLVCILRKHLMDEHEQWTNKGYITPKALESGLLMYKAYKDLGGNGMIDHMEEEIQGLPIKD